MRLMMLVNGGPESAAAIRASSLASRLPGDWTVAQQHRTPRKSKSLLDFIRSSLAFRPDLIYVMDMAYSGVIAASVLKAYKHCRSLVDTGDATHALALSRGDCSARQLRFIQWVEHLGKHRSDAVVVRGSYHRELLQAEGVRRVEFVPDGVDPEQFRPQHAGDLRGSLGLGDALVLGMVGSMNWSDRHRMCYGWDVIEALGLLRGEPAKALLVGDGNGKTRLESRARELGVGDRVVFTGNLPYEALPAYISAMDVCVSTQSNNVVGMVRTTGKVPLYLACGRYVAATDVGEARRVLPGVGCLLPYEGVRDDGHPQRLAEHIGTLLKDRRAINVTETARKVALANFDYGLLASRVRDLCESLCSKS